MAVKGKPTLERTLKSWLPSLGSYYVVLLVTPERINWVQARPAGIDDGSDALADSDGFFAASDVSDGEQGSESNPIPTRGAVKLNAKKEGRPSYVG